MSDKLLASMAALAIGIAVVSCGQNEEPASKQSGSTGPATQQPRAEKQAEQPREDQRAEAEKQAQAEKQRQQGSEQTATERQAQQRQGQQTQQRNPPGQQATPPAVPLNLNPDQVLQAQKLLNGKGFNVGEIDGVIGPRTRRALMAFQRQQGLEPTGQIDQRTASALGVSVPPGSITSGRSGTGPQ